jgi:hypothetical protein
MYLFPGFLGRCNALFSDRVRKSINHLSDIFDQDIQLIQLILGDQVSLVSERDEIKCFTERSARNIQELQ